jgi:hypothetical protein
MTLMTVYVVSHTGWIDRRVYLPKRARSVRALVDLGYLNTTSFFVNKKLDTAPFVRLTAHGRDVGKRLAGSEYDKVCLRVNEL